MGKGDFANSGHFIVLRGITENGKILVADPNDYSRSLKTWNANLIFEQARGNAKAGGPFWVISK